MPGKNSFTSMSENLLQQGGQGFSRSVGTQNSRIIYPAIVRSIDDNANQNRIQAEIVNLDVGGRIIPGKDRDIPLSNLPICLPWESEFLHVRPKVGECVWVIAENPTDLTSPRFWKGPVITSSIKLPFQAYEESVNIFNVTSYNKGGIYGAPTLQTQIKQATVLPSQSEIALQGREDADVVLRPREIEIRVGKFKINSVSELNTETPCRIQLKQYDTNPNTTGIRNVDNTLNENFLPYSQLNIQATNINFISNEGKFREYNAKTAENNYNPRLKDYGTQAPRLHPVVFGDELMDLLKILIQFLLNHIHTPQNPPLTNNLSEQLEQYINSGKMQDLVSNHIRVN